MVYAKDEHLSGRGGGDGGEGGDSASDPHQHDDLRREVRRLEEVIKLRGERVRVQREGGARDWDSGSPWTR